MVKRLRSEGYWVRGVDLKYPEFSISEAHEFIIGDLRDSNFVERVLQYKGSYNNFYNFVPSKHIETFDEIYQFAADMGGAGFVFTGPVNIGSEEMVTINQLVDTAAKVAGKVVDKKHINGPLGVRGRNSNNDLIREKLGWDYSMTLEEGIEKTYNWIDAQLKKINIIQ